MVGLDPDELATAWIDDCAQNHRLCPKPEDAELPTRLLDVGGLDDGPECLHLIETTKGAKGKWVALSYCWGESKNFTTTTENLQDHLHLVKFHELPQTIQDAVIVTSGLGIRYLWVDTLCIVQDSDEDWQAEAAQMMNVYRNAYVTIAANEGDDAESGMYIDRNPLESRPCEIKFNNDEAKKSTRYRWIHPPRIPWRNIVKKAHLQTRGWTLQETTLSTRVIYYSKEGLCWQCREGIRQERVPAYLIGANDPLVPRRIFDAYVGDPMNIFELWCDLVEEYTSRGLTRQTDKLTAISGLASALAAFIQARSERRLASREEKKYYSAPKITRHWAVPKNPEAVGLNRHDGGNLSFRDILTKEELSVGRPLYTHVRGPLSMDPFLAMRFIGGVDKDADEKLLLDPSPRNIEILKYVGLGPFLTFKDNKDNPDYDDEFLLAMSHPDTHAAYNRAYHIWKDDKDGKVNFDTLKEESPAIQPDDSQSTISESSDEPDMTDDFWIAACAHDAGYQYGSAEEPKNSTSQRTNMYIYGGLSPVKAIVEWPGYTMDSTYLAGLWKADLLHQLRWWCEKPGRRALKYRAPTWSWASMDDTRICYSRTGSDYRRQESGKSSEPGSAKLIGIEVVPSGPNRLGDLKSARLTLLAPVRDIPFTVAQVETSQPPSEPLESVQESMSIIPRSESAQTPLELDREKLHLDEESRPIDPSLKILRLSMGSWLIIEPAMDQEEHEAFRRVGHWVCSNDGSADFGGPPGSKKGLGGWETKEIVLI
jgi:Heterokaryon incompatibility protein (HET)